MTCTQAHDTQDNNAREIRVFLSSTFRDMDAERDVLMKQVFPQLRQFCAERAVALTEIDLRWGVSEEASKNGRTVEICLQEIDRCRGYPPFFIGFLGERYGWLPRHDELHSYWQEHKDSPYAKRIEQALDARIGITELEIRFGVLDHGVGTANARIFLRAPELTAELAGAQGADDPDGKLRNLKDELRREGLVAVDGYRSIEEFAAAVQNALMEAIEQRYPKDAVPDALILRNRSHTHYAESRLRGYV